VTVRAPVIIEKCLKVDDIARLSMGCPKGMTMLHADLSADLGYWRNIPTHTHPLVSMRIGEIKDIRAWCWYPGVVVFPLQFSLHILYKQPQCILSIWNVLECDLCMLAKMSGMDVD